MANMIKWHLQYKTDYKTVKTMKYINETHSVGNIVAFFWHNLLNPEYIALKVWFCWSTFVNILHFLLFLLETRFIYIAEDGIRGYPHKILAAFGANSASVNGNYHYCCAYFRFSCIVPPLHVFQPHCYPPQMNWTKH